MNLKLAQMIRDFRPSVNLRYELTQQCRYSQGRGWLSSQAVLCREKKREGSALKARERIQITLSVPTQK